jgi:hypothetical protein
MRRTRAVDVIVISDLLSIDARKIVVRVAETGKALNLPNREYVQLWPGRVVVPMWLSRKIQIKSSPRGRGLKHQKKEN